MKIAFIGKFQKLHDEEYIARSFEMLGHEVVRIDQSSSSWNIKDLILESSPDILLYTKWECPAEVMEVVKFYKIKTVCWLFDLYFDYPREWQVKVKRFFRSDFVFTTDGGHDEKWKEYRINHHCVRQGMYRNECYLEEGEKIHDLVFVGSENALYEYRTKLLKKVSEEYPTFQWFGRKNTDEVRGKELNKLYAKTKIVLGDSVYSPKYWSNRVVETLGRGGFLIHPEVEGLNEEFPNLVTYRRGDFDDLKGKIDYFLTHDAEREEIRKLNHEWVKERYTMDKKCAELISKL